MEVVGCVWIGRVWIASCMFDAASLLYRSSRHLPTRHECEPQASRPPDLDAHVIFLEPPLTVIAQLIRDYFSRHE
jgi:hypothetical protein